MFFVPFDPYTPYIEGRERAIDENWEDIWENNRSISAQLQNLFDADTYYPRTRDVWTDAGRNALALASESRAAELEGLLHPGNLARSSAQSRYWLGNADPYTRDMYNAQRAGMSYDAAMAGTGARMLPLQEQEYLDSLERNRQLYQTMLNPDGAPGTAPVAPMTPTTPTTPSYGWSIKPNSATTPSVENMPGSVTIGPDGKVVMGGPVAPLPNSNVTIGPDGKVVMGGPVDPLPNVDTVIPPSWGWPLPEGQVPYIRRSLK